MVEHVGLAVEADGAEFAFVRPFVGVNVVVFAKVRKGRKAFVRTDRTLVGLQVRGRVLRVHVDLQLGLVPHDLSAVVTLKVEVGLVVVSLQDGRVFEDLWTVGTGVFLGSVILENVDSEVL